MRKNHSIRNSVNRTALIGLLCVCLGITVAGCGTQGVKETNPNPNMVPKKEWGTFHGNLRWESSARDFPGTFYVRSMNGRKLKGRVKDKRIDCLIKDCKLHPGSHSIEVDYYWSTSHTKKERNRTQMWEGLGLILGIFAGGGASFPSYSDHDNPCKITLTFEVQKRREYALNIIHTVQQEQPEEFQIVDIESGGVIASASPSCQMLHNTPLLFSNQHVPDDQCAIHIFMGKDRRVEQVIFNVNESRTYEARRRKAYTFLEEPGEQLINVSVARNAALSNKRNTETIVVQCSAGETKYIQLDVIGFWTSRPAAIELTIEDAQPLISKIMSKSK